MVARERRYLLSAERRNSPPLFGSRRVFCRRYRPAAAPLPSELPWRRFPRASRHLRRAGLGSDTDTCLSTAASAPCPPRPPPRGRARGRPPALRGRAALPPPRAALTAEFVSDPSRELLGNLTPGSGCKTKQNKTKTERGVCGDECGQGRLVRHPALLPSAAPRRAGPG